MEDLMYLGEIVFRLFRLLGFFGLLGRVWTISYKRLFRTNDYFVQITIKILVDPGVWCGNFGILKLKFYFYKYIFFDLIFS